MLAVAEWAKAVADEGGRGRANPKVRGGAQTGDVVKQEEKTYA
jgi:hypothetical protein